MLSTSGLTGARSGWSLAMACAAAAIAVQAARTADAQSRAADPMAQAVIDSLAFPPRTAPAELLDAAIRAADVDAFDVALEYFSRLRSQLEKAGADRMDLLADLGEAADPTSLRRLERLLGDRDTNVRPTVQAFRDAASLRRRAPDQLARQAADLASDSAATRRTAAFRLLHSGVDALPVLVDLLQSETAQEPTRTLARGIVRDLGPEAVPPLLAWLGSDDVDHWPGVIEALAATMDSADDEGHADFLLAPALAVDSPPAARDRAVRVLRQIAARRSAAGDPDAMAAPPGVDAAVAILAHRLDRVLSPDGLPLADQLCVEPVTDPAVVTLTGKGSVERFVWDPRARRPVRMDLPPQAARAEEAIHLARDLAALDGTAPDVRRLVMLARLESLLATAGDPLTAVDRLTPEQVQTALSGPDGFDHEEAADVLDLAASRGMFAAATATARALAAVPPPAGSAALPPDVRKSLVRALAVPDAPLQFEAARTLARAAGDPPYRGSSRVVEVLLHAATSTGEDVVVVAHPEHDVRESVATGLSRLGYRAEKVASGREAILAARASSDTVLVMLSARIVRPTALETVQFIQLQAMGDVPPVLVMVDPLDDNPRSCFITQLILKFSDLTCVGITDRLDSLFQPQIDPVTHSPRAAPRLFDQLAQVAGPQAVVPATRQSRAALRRARASEALALLAALGKRRGWDVSAAETTARLAVMRSPLTGTPHDLFAPAVALLGAVGSSEAQQALLREAQADDLPEPARAAAQEAFAASVRRYGRLLECGVLQDAYARYNRATDPAARARAAAILDVLEAPTRQAPTVSADAAHPRPIR